MALRLIISCLRGTLTLVRQPWRAEFTLLGRLPKTRRYLCLSILAIFAVACGETSEDGSQPSAGQTPTTDKTQKTSVQTLSPALPKLATGKIVTFSTDLPDFELQSVAIVVAGGKMQLVSENQLRKVDSQKRCLGALPAGAEPTQVRAHFSGVEDRQTGRSYFPSLYADSGVAAPASFGLVLQGANEETGTGTLRFLSKMEWSSRSVDFHLSAEFSDHFFELQGTAAVYSGICEN
jgi:hypothetical protein